MRDAPEERKSKQRRHLVSLIDGTMISASQAPGFTSYSNVYELGYLLKLRTLSQDGHPQIGFYTSGISSQPDTRDTLDMITGSSIYSQIVDQYTNICANYDFDEADEDDRDRIYIFGYSRGGMAARALAGLICAYGLLKPRDIRAAPAVVAAWQQRQNPPDEIDLHPASVEFLGVFDSVMGGVERMKMFNPIRFPDALVPKGCKNAVHLLAIDEDRRFFKAKLWDGRKGGHDSSQPGGFHQIWMPGVHADVGGTGNNVWGRAAMLTMMHFIDRYTDLTLDDDWRKDKESKLKTSIDEGRIFVKRHRPIHPFRLSRVPIATEATAESYHPIIDMIDSWTVDEKEGFDWRGQCFSPHFSGLESKAKEPELHEYFNRFLR